jgi:serine/threonine protein kinase
MIHEELLMAEQVLSCPEIEHWKALLEESLSESEQASLNKHLESCERCQGTVSGLAATKELWAQAARHLGRGPQDDAAALHQLLADLEEEAAPPDRHRAADLGEDLPPGFLSPSKKVGHLGRLGHYEISQIVGRGGMGVVLKAFDEHLQRVVAIKVLAPQLAASAAARKRFVREARAAAAVRNEHVIGIYAVEETNGLPYVVMEYINGPSLLRRLEQPGPLQLKEILRIAAQIATGLAAAHAQGLIHRDIKPGNILLENGVERVKITDFGLARAVDDAGLTATGTVVGTPPYMAPEQARGEAVDHRADLFSLGSVLYALCTGQAPFHGSNTPAVLRRVADEAPRPILEINPEIPDWLVAIIQKLHAKDPAQRFQTATEVADVLNRELARLQRPSPPAQPAPPTSPTSSRAGWPVVAGVAIAAMIAAGFWLWSVSRPNRSSLVLASNLPEFSVYIDGKRAMEVDRSWDHTRAVVPVPRGARILSVAKPGFKASPEEFDLSKVPQSVSIDWQFIVTNEREFAEWVIQEKRRRIGLHNLGRIFPDRIDQLADLPPDSFLIQTVELSSAHLQNDDAEKFSALTALQYLYLSHNRELTDSGIAKILEYSPQLRGLFLIETGLTDHGLETLAHQPTIQNLDISGTQITDKGVSAIARMPNLGWLRLVDTKLSLAGLLQLKDARKLIQLHVKSSQLTSVEREQLRQSLPNCEVVVEE